MDADSLEKLKTLMIGKRLKIAVAESLTCGKLQATLGSANGASEFFEGGITAYNLKQKNFLLGVEKQHAESVNSVSQQVAFQLASGVCKLFQTDIGIGTTGYAEPSPENGATEPMAYFAICRNVGGKIENIAGQHIQAAGLDREQMQEHVCSIALETLLNYLENL
ncbi:MAG: CinA family protein [Methylomonas sp.]